MSQEHDNYGVNGAVNGAAVERRVFDAEFADDSGPTAALSPQERVRVGTTGAAGAAGAVVVRLVGLVWRVLVARVRQAWQSPSGQRARAVLGYRVRKAPADAARLVWFVVRGHWRWLVKFWNWATYADLRADARRARLAGDSAARRDAQELIRSDATARWAKVGITLRRVVIGARLVGPVAVVLWAVDSFVDRSAMWPWLAGLYSAMDTVWTVFLYIAPMLATAAPVMIMIGAAFEGRDRSPGAAWLIRPDRTDADSWVDERMISKALAHLGITPLDRFYKDGGELTYTVAARKDGDGTFAQIRLPMGVTADMVAARRSKLAANLGRASLETWPTKGDEDGILDLWIADKGTLRGGAGEWPLVDDGQVDLFDGVPFGLSQRGLVINAPLIGVNWLIGGRPGQGKSAALRTLMLGAALDPTAELWVFVMGQSPDFDPFAPRLSRYRMGMEDEIAEAATRALEDLLAEMERRGKVLGEQPGRPPKVSRALADKPGLGLHPLVCGIDECHELFQHPRFGKKAADLAVRLVKRGRKYGIVVLLATQSPTKDSIPREITRNVACGVAFSVADQVANDGLLGSGKYAAGIRATELRINTDRGTCVAVGITDESFELVRTFYVPLEDGADDVSPVIARACALVAEAGRALPSGARAELEPARPAIVDTLTDLALVMRDGRRVRTQVVLSRLAEHNPVAYEGWSPGDLTAALAEFDIVPRKSGGFMVVRAEDVTDALSAREVAIADGEADGESAGSGGVLPADSLTETPCPDQRKRPSGRQGGPAVRGTRTPRIRGAGPTSPASLPEPPPPAEGR